MPHEVSTESNGVGVVVSFTGDIAGAEIVTLNDRLASDAAFSLCHYQIWDFSKARHLEISIDDLRSISLRDISASAENPGLKTAIVGEESFFGGKDRIFLIFEEVWTTYRPKFFRDVGSAREWASSDKP